MRTTKGTPWRLGPWGVAVAAVLLMATGASAQTGTCSNSDNCQVASDRAASILIYPKILVDTSNGLDTVIQLTNTSNRRTVDVLCYWVNANGHCSSSDDICQNDLECLTGEICIPGWGIRDFELTLTKRQPVSWKASEGTNFLPCDSASPTSGSCTIDDQGVPILNTGNVPRVQEDPFVGELKCIQIDESNRPVDFNDLKGEATTVRVTPGGSSTTLDVSKYNAIGVQAIPGQNTGGNVLCLGGESPTDDCANGAEYAGCPQTLIMNHFFEGATETASSSTVTSDLTLVPCAQDFDTISTNLTTVTPIQFLIFNEFEQRTSTSFRISCFEETPLADIDTRPGAFDNGSSIFSVGTQGTVTGQSRLRAVSSNGQARGYIGILEEFHTCTNGPDGRCTASVNLHYQGRRQLTDLIRIADTVIPAESN